MHRGGTLCHPCGKEKVHRVCERPQPRFVQIPRGEHQDKPRRRSGASVQHGRTGLRQNARGEESGIRPRRHEPPRVGGDVPRRLC